VFLLKILSLGDGNSRSILSNVGITFSHAIRPQTIEEGSGVLETSARERKSHLKIRAVVSSSLRSGAKAARATFRSSRGSGYEKRKWFFRDEHTVMVTKNRK